ncbi:MAG: hypothetical protein ACK5S9_14310 [Roseiflexaceae bacterium]|jgi:hypothetical protein
MDNNHTRATTPVHAVHDSPYLEQVLRLTCIGILWVATFWCIPYVLGQLSTALVVTGRVVAVAIAGVLMFRVRGTQWSLATSIGHTSVVGLIYAILPMVLFFCIGAIVPRSQPVAATMLATLGFVLARILLIGHPQRLRVLVLTNIGIISIAWLVSPAPGGYLAGVGALLFVVAVNTCVVWAAGWYTERFLAELPVQVTRTTGSIFAIAWLLPIVSWYGTMLPNDVTVMLWALLIWCGAIAISWLYRSDHIRLFAPYLAVMCLVPGLLLSIPQPDSNVQIVRSLVFLLLSIVTGFLLGAKPRA